MIENDSWVFYEWFVDYKNHGILPFGSDTIGEEPAQILEIVEVCGEEISAIERRIADKMKDQK